MFKWFKKKESSIGDDFLKELEEREAERQKKDFLHERALYCLNMISNVKIEEEEESDN